MGRGFLRTVCMVFTLAIAVVGANAEERILRRGSGGEPDTLDPQKSTLAIEAAIIGEFLHGFVKRDGKGRIVPACAESWVMSEDGLTYTFKLRDELKWSDGVPLTSDDFVAGIRRLFDPATAAINSSLFFLIENGRAAVRGEVPLEAVGVRAIGPQHVEIRLLNPEPNFLSMLTGRLITPIPRHAIERNGDAWIKPGHSVANGPFRLVKWSAHELVALERNPEYYDANNVAFDKIIYYPTTDLATGVKKFRAGEIDYLRGYPTTDYDRLKSILGDQVKRAPVHSVSYLIPNFEKALYRDERLLKALSLALDRRILAEKVLRGSAQPAWRYTPFTVTGYEAADLPFANTPMAERRAEARRLLAETGYGGSNPLRITLNVISGGTGKNVAIALRAMWQQVGIEATIETLEMRVHYSNMDHQKFDLGFSAWIGYDDPYLYLSALVSDEGAISYNSGHYSNETFDALLAEAVTIADRTARFAKFASAEKLLLDDVGVIPLYYGTAGSLVSSALEGYHDNAWGTHASEYMRFNNVEPLN